MISSAEVSPKSFEEVWNRGAVITVMHMCEAAMKLWSSNFVHTAESAAMKQLVTLASSGVEYMDSCSIPFSECLLNMPQSQASMFRLSNHNRWISWKCQCHWPSSSIRIHHELSSTIICHYKLPLATINHHIFQFPAWIQETWLCVVSDKRTRGRKRTNINGSRRPCEGKTVRWRES